MAELGLSNGIIVTWLDEDMLMDIPGRQINIVPAWKWMLGGEKGDRGKL